MNMQHAVDRAEEVARVTVVPAIVFAGVSVQKFGSGIVQLGAVCVAIGFLWSKVIWPTCKKIADVWRKIDMTWDQVQCIPEIKEAVESQGERLRAQAELHIMGTALAAEQSKKIDELTVFMRTIVERDPKMRTRRTDLRPEELTE